MEKSMPVNIQQIRSTIEDEYSLVIPSQCDEFIARCLRQKDGSIENAVKLVRAYYDAISNLRVWDAKLLPSLGVEADKTGISMPLKTRDQNGRYIFVLRPGLWNPTLYNFEQGVVFLWMLMQYISAHHVEVQRHGFVTVWDFTGLSLQQAMAINQRKLLSLGKWTHSGVMGRMKALHAVNHPRVIGLVYKGIKPFLKEKLKERIILHDSFESLQKHMGAQYLPTFLGGNLDPEKCRDMSVVNGYFNSDKYFQDMLAVGFPDK